MAAHNINPVREQLRAEILSVLANSREPMTTQSLYHYCEYATSAEEVSRVAYEMKKKGLIADGGKVPHSRGTPVNSYILANPEDPRIEASKVANAAPKIKPTRQPAIKRKPAPGHPFAAPIRPQAAHDSLPRVTRDLPINLQSPAPIAVLEEATMPEAPADYVIDPDAFTLEPSALEALEGVDSDLAQALFAMSQMDDVGEITQAIAKKNCHCAKITAPPKMPSGFKYSLFSTEIHSEDDDSYMCFETGGPESGTITLSARGDMTFDLDEINMIPEVAAFLNSLHVSE